MATQNKLPNRDPLLPFTHYQRIGRKPLKGNSGFKIWPVVIVTLLILGAGAYYLNSEIEALKKESQPLPEPTISQENEPVMTPKAASPSVSPAKDGQFCGGIAGIECSQGSICKLDGDYPDAGGKCVSAKATVAIPTLAISQSPIKPTESVVMCTQDAQQCPDGSWVGRSGPTCAFNCP